MVPAGKLRKLWDSLSELRSSLCERRLEMTVLRHIYAGIRTFNSLLPGVTFFMCDKKKFKAAFRKYLNTHSY